MATNRVSIRNSLVTLLKDQLDGTNYTSNCYNTVVAKQVFWDELTSYPTIAVVNGSEKTEYQPGGFTWKYLNILIKTFHKIDDEGAQLEQMLEDIENILDANNDLEYSSGETVEQLSLLSVDTDEGLLYPFSVSEISILVQYQGNMTFI